MKGPGRYQVEFANVDDRMTLIDQRRARGRARVYLRRRTSRIPSRRRPTSLPRPWPCSNVSVEASDLVLKRDIYYTQYPDRIRL